MCKENKDIVNCMFNRALINLYAVWWEFFIYLVKLADDLESRPQFMESWPAAVLLSNFGTCLPTYLALGRYMVLQTLKGFVFFVLSLSFSPSIPLIAAYLDQSAS